MRTLASALLILALLAIPAAGQIDPSTATSALAVRQLLDEVGGFGIANLLRDLGAGVDFEAAFAHRIQRSFTDWMASR